MIPRNVLALGLGTAFVLAATLPAGAQAGWKPKKSKIPDEQVDKAIENGVNYLKQNGNFAPGGHKGATSEELVFYTLYHGGLPKSDPVFQQYLKRIVDKDPAHTYSTSLASMCLSELHKVGYQWKIEQFAQFLVDNQCENGQWTYGEPIRLEKKVDPSAIATSGAGQPQVVETGTASAGAGQVLKASPKANTPVNNDDLYGVILPKGAEAKAGDAAKSGGRTQSMSNAVPRRIPIKQRRRCGPSGDNSNSQYASLGLRACAEAGFEIDEKCVRDALKWWESEQCGDGGWGYGPGEGKSWGSMTVGGIGAVSIYKWMLRQDWRGDSRVNKGINWINDKWTVDKNPLAQENKADRVRWHYYYLYGIERAGMIYGTDFMGAHDWYDEGAAYLIKNQDPNGSWKNDVWDTCFAILFLRRATKSLPPKIYTGQ